MRSNSPSWVVGPSSVGLAGENLFSPAFLLRSDGTSGEFDNSPEDEDDQDTGDVPAGIDADALDLDPLDTDRITSPD